MDPEKRPLLSEDIEQAEKSVDTNTGAEPYIHPLLREWLCRQETSAGLESVPRLVLIKTQAIRWTWSASIVAITQAVRYLISYEPGVTSILITAATLGLLTIVCLCPQPGPNTSSSTILALSLCMIIFSELPFPIRQIADWTMQDTTTPLTFRQSVVLRFLLAYYARQHADIDTPNSHIPVPDDGAGVTRWCQVPFNPILVGGQWMWERSEKVRGVCHIALGYTVLYGVARALMYVLGMTSFSWVGFQIYGAAGCLTDTEWFWQTFAMQPLYTLIFWLCHQVLRAVGRGLELARKGWSISV